MSNLKKTYVIDIQMDSAQQQLADAIKKLQALDAQLEGLDRDSEAGKKLVAEMAAAAKAVQGLTAEVEGLSDELDSLKPGSPAALKKQVEELERAFYRTTEGTKEFDEALLALSRAEGELAGLQTKIDALDPEKQTAAFIDFTNGIVGGFSIATVAAQQWGGLSAESAQQVEQRLQSLLVVMSAFEAISKATSGEVLANVKNMYALGKGFLFGAESASVSSKIIRGALVATGIGAIVLLVSLLVAGWDKFKTTFGGSEKLFTKIKEVASGVFSGLIASLKSVGQIVMKLWEGDFSGAVAKAKNVGKDIAAGYAAGVQEVVDDSNRKLLAKQIEVQERLLKVQQAGGLDTAKLQRQILADKLKVLKNTTEEEQKAHADAAAELAAFDAAEAKKQRAEALASTMARINGVIALEEAGGKSSYRSQLNAKQTALKSLLDAAKRGEDVSAALIKDKRAEIAAFEVQHQREVAAKRRALLIETQQNEVALLDEQGKDTLQKRIQNARDLLDLDTGTGEQELAQKRADKQALLLLEEQYNTAVREGLKANQEQRQELEQQGRDVDKELIDAAGNYAYEAYNKSLAKLSLGESILTKLFGVKPENLEQVKAGIAEAYNAIQQTVTEISTAILSENISALDSQISAIQERISQLDQQAQAHNQAAQDAEGQLAAATGARRDYLLKKISEERAAEAKLLADKKKAAAEEAKLAKEKEKNEKQLQAVSLASAAANAIAAGLAAVASAAAIPFPANIPAILTAIATVSGAVLSARQLGKSLGDGGVIEGGSHASGNDVPVFGGRYRVEGGEAITPVDATSNNAAVLELIRTKGRNRRLTPMDYFNALAGDAQGVARSIVPTPKTYFDAGGILYKGGTPGGQASSQDLAAMTSQLYQLNGQVAQLVASNGSIAESSAATQAHTADAASSNQTLVAFGPPRMVRSHQEVLEDEQLLKEAKQAQKDVTL